MQDSTRCRCKLFVENAIKYSFRGYEGAHRLTIEVSKAEEQMHIIIANNGRHIEEDQLKDLNMGKEIKNHFGISNVRKRLKLYYGEDAVIYFENVSPSGSESTFVCAIAGGTKR